MLLLKSGFLKVWNVFEESKKFTKLSGTTGDKQQDGTYKNSSWNVTLIGEANQLKVREGDTIVIESAKVESIYNKENKKTYTNLVIFKGEIQKAKKK